MIDDSWYPSSVVKLTMRFDEAIQIAKPRDEITVDAMSAQTPEARVTGETTTSTQSGQRTLSTGRHRPRPSLEAARLNASDQLLPSSALAPGAGTPIRRKGSGETPRSEIEPLTFGTDTFTVIANRVPKKATYILPHPRTAPTFRIELDFSEFPIDPRLLRAVGVEIHLGSISAEDYARGMVGEVDEDGRPFSILKTTTDIVDPFTGRKMVNDGTLLFYGTCDTWDVEHSEAGSFIVLEGREIRGILIDVKIIPSDVDKVKLDQPINDVIADLIQTIKFEHGFRLTTATDATEWPSGIVPSPGDAGGLTKVRARASSATTGFTKTREGDQQGGGSGTRASPENGSKCSYWDLITNYCQIVGAMPHIVGSMLWIRPVHRIFEIVDPRSKIPSPFARGEPRTVGDENFRVRRLVVGRDMKRLKIQRKFGGVAIVPTVQCISFDDRGVGKQRLIFGQWPPDKSDAAEGKAEGELMRVPMWGIRSVERLTQIARGIYEEIGRGETGGTAETHNLATFGGDNADPDVLRMRPLEPIEFAVDASSLRTALPVVSEVNERARMTFSEEVDQVAEIIGDRLVARALVALSRSAVQEVLRYYQVVGVQFDVDKGVRTQISFQNYITPRHQADAVTDVRVATKEIRAKPIRVVGGGRKAKVKAKPVSVVFSDFQRVEPEAPKRPRPLLTPQERGRRGLQ